MTEIEGKDDEISTIASTTSQDVAEESENAVKVEIPFPSERDAVIVYNSLRVDKEPKRSHVRRHFSVDAHILTVTLQGGEVKHIRTALNGFFDSVLLCMHTLERFGGNS